MVDFIYQWASTVHLATNSASASRALLVSARQETKKSYQSLSQPQKGKIC